MIRGVLSGVFWGVSSVGLVASVVSLLMPLPAVPPVAVAPGPGAAPVDVADGAPVSDPAPDPAPLADASPEAVPEPGSVAAPELQPDPALTASAEPGADIAGDKAPTPQADPGSTAGANPEPDPARADAASPHPDPEPTAGAKPGPDSVRDAAAAPQAGPTAGPAPETGAEPPPPQVAAEAPAARPAPEGDGSALPLPAPLEPGTLAGSIPSAPGVAEADPPHTATAAPDQPVTAAAPADLPDAPSGAGSVPTAPAPDVLAQGSGPAAPVAPATPDPAGSPPQGLMPAPQPPAGPEPAETVTVLPEAAAPKPAGPVIIQPDPAAPDAKAPVAGARAVPDTDGATATTDPPAPVADRPQPGFASTVEGVQSGRLPRIGADPAPEADPPPAPVRALDRNARPFDNLAAKPPFAVLLLDDPASTVDLAVLAGGDLPLTLVIDPTAPDASARAAIWRNAGQEVALLTNALPARGRPSDYEVAMESLAGAFPQALALVDTPTGGVQGDRTAAAALVPALAARGFGLVTWDRGLNAADQVARRDGLPAATIFRELDAGDEATPVIRRYLDRAAFKAQQDGRAVVIGRLRPETVAALLEWALDGRAGALALAPVSALLTAP